MELGVIDVILTIILAIAVFYAVQLLSKDLQAAKPSTKPNSSNGSVSNADEKSSNSNATTTAVKSGPVPEILFLFGSESGTAENFAYDVAEESSIYGFKSTVRSLEDLSPLDLESQQFVVFVVATHGEGEPTSNAVSFWEEWVTKANAERESNSLPELVFAVFGLGNRQYRHFNAVAKRIQKELIIAGAEPLIPIHLGDDDGTMEEDMETFRTDFWQASRERFLADAGALSLATAPTFNSTYDVTIYPAVSEHVKDYVGGLAKVERYFNDPVHEHRTGIVTVTDAHELRTAKDDALDSTTHLDLSLEKTRLTYRTADTLGIHPRNPFKLAGRLATRLNVDMDTIFSVKTSNSNRRIPLPNPCSVQDAFLYFLDILSIPKHKFAAIFATYADDKTEQQKLQWFADHPEGKAEFQRLRYNWVDLLAAFPSVDIPFSHVLEMIPRLQPRLYTISSSSKTHPKTVSLTVTRLFGTKPHDNSPFTGLCSDYLCHATDDKNNKQMVAFVKQSLFRLPYRAGTPIIMIGPGTGLAPFRGFIQEFYTRQVGHEFGETLLFFGCRHPEKDFIYREELEQAKTDGKLTDLLVAFSRVPDQPKVYVQDLVKQQAERLWGLIEKGAYIYVCGGTAMGRDVLQVFRDLVAKYGQYNAEQAETFVDKMIRQNRYVQELWSA